MNDQQAKGNPYSAPLAQEDFSNGDRQDVVPQTTLGQIGKRVFLEWEKLRLVYIGILVTFTVLIGLSQLGHPGFWLVAVFGGVVANLCFFTGPIIETYVTWLGFRSVAIRWVMFVAGTLFTMASAAATIFSLPSLK